MMTTTGTSGKDATLSANLGEHQRHVPSAVAMQIAPIVVPRINSQVLGVARAVVDRRVHYYRERDGDGTNREVDEDVLDRYDQSSVGALARHERREPDDDGRSPSDVGTCS